MPWRGMPGGQWLLACLFLSPLCLVVLAEPEPAGSVVDETSLMQLGYSHYKRVDTQDLSLVQAKAQSKDQLNLQKQFQAQVSKANSMKAQWQAQVNRAMAGMSVEKQAQFQAQLKLAMAGGHPSQDEEEDEYEPVISFNLHSAVHSSKNSLLQIQESHAKPGLDFVKDQYLSLLSKALTGSLNEDAGSCDQLSQNGCSKRKPFDPIAREKGNDWPPYGQTMAGSKRLKTVRMAIEETVKNNVPGDFAELGVWRGGASIYAKALYNLEGQKDRKVHLFDAFDGIPQFSHFLTVPQKDAEHNFQKYKVMDDNVKFHKGFFKDTIPSFAVTHPGVQLAVLRVDGNFYNKYKSTISYDLHQDVLYHLYPRVPVGGFVIFDDFYTDPRIEQAWLEFKADNNLPEEVTKIDDVSAILRKTKEVTLDVEGTKPVEASIVYPEPVDADVVDPAVV